MAEGNELTVIGADSHFEGKLRFERAAKVNGRFDGEIVGKGELTVAQSAECKASVSAGAIAVDGRIEGNVQAGDTVRLNSTGVVKGDITAAKMVMQEGASFYGMCSVGPDAQKLAGAAKPATPPANPPAEGAGKK